MSSDVGEACTPLLCAPCTFMVRTRVCARVARNLASMSGNLPTLSSRDCASGKLSRIDVGNLPSCFLGLATAASGKLVKSGWGLLLRNKSG
jgi:hypothetical protein